LNGELDAGLVILPVPKDSLEVEPVLSEPVVAAVPEQHSLAFKKAVALQDLDELPLISLAKRLHPYCYEDIHLRCLQQGYQPRIAQEVSSFPEAMALVAEGIGFAFTRECYEPFCCRGIQAHLYHAAHSEQRGCEGGSGAIATCEQSNHARPVRPSGYAGEAAGAKQAR